MNLGVILGFFCCCFCEMTAYYHPGANKTIRKHPGGGCHPPVFALLDFDWVNVIFVV